MRLVLAVLALAGTLLAVITPTRAQSLADDRYVIAFGGMGADVVKAVRAQREEKARRHDNRHLRQFTRHGHYSSGQIVGGRPRGCPHAFCGCGASLYLFGRIIPALNLAASWLRYPRAAPAPDMVAARPGHVFVLKQHIAGDVWLVFDANSGGHRTRIHARSIAGFSIVNPR